jgi:EAL domain-containing protein (putative c-di-GMP-specific phosphodiesterase class I)
MRWSARWPKWPAADRQQGLGHPRPDPAVGVRVSLDDFGTGFSQINYLRRFRFDEITLDRTLVRDMHDDLTAHAIVLGAVTFARGAGLAIVAEGIERREQADQLRDLGCTHGQGYLFGVPCPTASPA